MEKVDALYFIMMVALFFGAAAAILWGYKQVKEFESE